MTARSRISSLAILLAAAGGAGIAAAQTPIPSWRGTLRLPIAIPVVDAVEYRGHILAFAPDGGRTFVGDVDPDTGDVLGWRDTLPIPTYVNRVAAGVVVIGDHVVVPGAPSSAVGALAADGSILAWHAASGTITPATGARAVAVDGRRIYAVGGGAPFQVFNSVETATLDAAGALSSWQLLTPLPVLMNDGLALVSDGHLYAFGGHGSTPGGDLSHARDVHRAPILADGTIAAWSFVGLLLEPRTNGDFFRFEDTVHVIAGGVNSFMTSSVESALVSELGSTSRHVLSAPLPTVLNDHAAVVVGGFGYVLGGNDRAFGGGPQDAVYVTELAACAPMTVAAAASPARLWPPNHRWIDVSIVASTVGGCDATPSCAVVEVSSDEPVDGTGAGDTSPDWEVVDATLVRLRAERAAAGDGREYSIRVDCEDDAGNVASSIANVIVPRSQGN